MRLSLSEISTVGATFEEDVRAYAAAGFDAIGIWEFKLPPDDEANLALLAEQRPTSKAGREVATFIFEVINQNDHPVQRGRMLVLVRTDQKPNSTAGG